MLLLLRLVRVIVEVLVLMVKLMCGYSLVLVSVCWVLVVVSWCLVVWMFGWCVSRF